MHFIEDVEQIRKRAAQKLEEGPVTETYKGDADKTVSILNEALATEIVCVLRYMHHYFMATGVHGKSVAKEFKEHADAEREHADMIGERIQQLGGKPDFNPKSLLERSASQYVEGETLGQMIREDLIAERIVIEVYQEMIRYFGNNDPTTRIMIEHILKDEEEHASDLSDLLYITDPETGKTEGKDPGVDALNLETKKQNSGRDELRPAEENQMNARSHEENQSAQLKRANRGKAQNSKLPPPDFYMNAEAERGVSPQTGWRPGEKNPAASTPNLQVRELAQKRHESPHAGPPGAPEFSAGPRHANSKEKKAQSESRNKRGEKQSEKNWKVAKPRRKPAA